MSPNTNAANVLIYEWLKNKPVEVVAALCVAQIVFWGVLPALFMAAPPLDVVEMLSWGQEWQLGYYKHPPLPAWLAELSYQLGGGPIFGPVITSQLCIVLTFVFVYLLGKRLVGPTHAALGTLLLTGVFYFSFPTPELNHNIVQMPVWAAILYTFSMVWEHPEKKFLWHWPWLFMGALFGIGLYAKYAVVILVMMIAGWVLADRRLRPILWTLGPWLGAGLAFLIALPHLTWLWNHDFLPLRYAQERSGQNNSIWSPFKFVLAQLADHLPMLIPIAAAFPLWWKRSQWSRQRDSRASASADGPLFFLLITTLAPMTITAVLALISGSGLRTMWGAPMFATSGLLVVALLAPHLTLDRVSRMTIGCAALLIMVPVIYVVRLPVSAALGKKPTRVAWPMAELAEKSNRIWRSHSGVPSVAPLAYVGGDTWLAGLVSAGTANRPHLLIGSNGEHSPWISMTDIERKGIMLLNQNSALGADMFGFAASTNSTGGTFQITLPGTGPKTIHYLVVKPR